MTDICMFGLPKAGKTSIIKVIFQKLQINQTSALESTKIQMGSFIKFNIYDFSGEYDLSDPSPPDLTQLEQCGSMIFVIDGSIEPYHDSAIMFRKAVQLLKNKLQTCNCNYFHIFIHKTDLQKNENFVGNNDILQRVRNNINEELGASQMKNLSIDYHLTNIIEPGLYEHFSKVIQKIIPYSLPIQSLLDALNTACKIEKSFLFEITSKLYIASDSSPIDTENFQLCSEMIDVFIDITTIYGQIEEPGQSSITMDDGTILLYKSFDKLTALICMIKETNLERPYMVDYNLEQFKIGLQQLFKVK
ncbi:hypothetical protein pb186bvf_007713 [Paramecium bursaria]